MAKLLYFPGIDKDVSDQQEQVLNEVVTQLEEITKKLQDNNLVRYAEHTDTFKMCVEHRSNISVKLLFDALMIPFRQTLLKEEFKIVDLRPRK